VTVLAPGLAADVVHLVGDGDTAIALGSGDVPVLATPRLIALAEAAAVAAVAPALNTGQTTVGTRIEFEHLAASPVGIRVTVRAELTSVDGRLLRFQVTAEQADEVTRPSEGRARGREEPPAGRLVAHGWVTRVVVDRARFLQRSGAG
jgi:fluoroacetyl-CoA thioesterase